MARRGLPRYRPEGISTVFALLDLRTLTHERVKSLELEALVMRQLPEVRGDVRDLIVVHRRVLLFESGGGGVGQWGKWGDEHQGGKCHP